VEVLAGGKMTNRAFHGSINTHGSMPVEMVRVLMRQRPHYQ
jgi:hypothetical protein